jgi:TolB-like protein/Flp pilus assembly protein TadD
MHPFIEELKRRHVIRVAVIYMAAGWVLAEVAGFAADTFGAPDWVVQMFTIFILLGFPLVVIGAWAFEMTPQGLKRDTGPAVAGTDEPATDLAAQPGAPAVGMTPDQQAAQAVAVPAGSAPEPTAPPSPAAPPSEQSIAVLPFVNMSSDPEQEYFSDGLSEELLNLLAQIPSLRVAARTSSFSFKGEKIDIPAVADKLKVANVLEGSVRKAGNQVRVTAQLIKAVDGYHLWSETFDRTLEDIFAVQDEIAESVVDALKVSLLGAVPKARETNPEAYALYLHGAHFHDLGDPENLEKARQAFKQVLELDPDYAPAWDGLAGTYIQQTNTGQLGLQEGVALAREAGARALELDDTLAEAHAGDGFIKMVFDWDWAGATASIDRALELAPSNAKSVRRAGLLVANQGRFEEALALVKKAIELDPLMTAGYNNIAHVLTAMGRLDEAQEAARHIVSLNPVPPGAHGIIAKCYLLQGNPDAALAEADQEQDRSWRDYVSVMALDALGRREEADQLLQRYVEDFKDRMAVQVAGIYAHRGDVEEALSWLDYAYEVRDGGLSEMLGEPLFACLHDDPRWTEFLEKMGLPTSVA